MRERGVSDGEGGEGGKKGGEGEEDGEKSEEEQKRKDEMTDDEHKNSKPGMETVSKKSVCICICAYMHACDWEVTVM
jgi:hypothetical protein